MSRSQEERAKRLADALRQNLKRRKAQARGSPLAEPSEHDGKGDQNNDENDHGP